MSTELSLLRFLLNYPSHVVSGLGVDPAPGRLFHISPDPDITTFVPRKIKRTMKGEDELVERICTGVTLLDCFRGYAVSLNDFVKSKAHCAENNNWLGGYILYGINHEGCLIPSDKMAPIAEWCEERWLVSHLHDQQPYPSRKLGKAFINRLTVKKNSNDEKVIETELLLEIQEDGVAFTPELILDKGFHVVHIGSLEKYVKGQDLSGVFQYQRVSEQDYLRQKERRAELLSYESAHSTITHW